MSFLLPKKKKVALPAVPAPEAIPDVSQRTGVFAGRRTRGRTGFRGTIEAGLLVPDTKGKKKKLGG